MKKILFLMAFSMLFCINAVAKHHACSVGINDEYKGGGFIDTAIKPMSVAEVNKLSDDDYVVMTGYITKKLSSKKYNFTDGKDNITVKIREKVWNGQKVTPKDKIIVYGDLDKDFTSREVDVKSLKIVD